MKREYLIEKFEKETGKRWTFEFVVYNDYAEWLEQEIFKLYPIPDVIEQRDQFKDLLKASKKS